MMRRLCSTRPMLKWSRETMEVMSHSKKYMVKENGRIFPQNRLFLPTPTGICSFLTFAPNFFRAKKKTRVQPHGPVDVRLGAE